MGKIQLNSFVKPLRRIFFAAGVLNKNSLFVDTIRITPDKEENNVIEHDTIRLLRECDAGIQMGVSSIDDGLEYVSDHSFSECLSECRDKHVKLEGEIECMLHELHDDGKEPNPMAKGMSWVKTNVKLAVNDSDNTIADLITDGCNMGVKSLSKYLNKYKAADERSKSIAKRLICLENGLAEDIRGYL